MRKLLCTVTFVALSVNVAAAQNNDDQMLSLTQSVLQGIGGATEPASAETAVEQADLSSLISQAMEAGESDAFLDALIVEAVERGTIEVPDAMVSAGGDVDTKTLLASLVGQSLQNDTEDKTLVAEATGGAPEQEAEPRRHTVASGDSLAGIALQYYGDAAQYQTIFAANRATIERPSLIRVGQVILIP